MRKKLVALLCVCALALGAFTVLAACGDKEGDGEKPGGGKVENVVVWVSETEGVKTLTDTQVAAFLNANPDYKGKYNVVVEGHGEGEAATDMVTDVATGADIFCYAQDQLGRLVEAKAVSKLGTTSANFVKENNDEGSVRAVTVGTDVYSYPLTSDNGYFMYYDTDVVKAEHLDDLQSIVDDCKAANKRISFEIGGSAWYTASFFFGAGCTSSWTFNAETNSWKAADTFADETKGLIALKGTQILTKSGIWDDSSKASDFTAATPAGVVISGTWDATTAKNALGDKLGVAKLPKYKVGDTSYQLMSFSGFKLMGVKPQSTTERTEFCHKLAMYLTGEECQQQRLEQFSWGPSNKKAAASEAAKNNEALAGLAAQSPYSIPQGQIHGGWWNFAKSLGNTKDIPLNDETELKKLLTQYTKDLAHYEQMSEEDMNAFGVIGSLAAYQGDDAITIPVENLATDQAAWVSWNADLRMTKTENGNTVVWKTNMKVKLTAGDEFKVRMGQSWDTQYAKVGEDGHSAPGDGNFVITEDNAGEYYIVLTLTMKDDKVDYAVVSLSAE